MVATRRISKNADTSGSIMNSCFKTLPSDWCCDRLKDVSLINRRSLMSSTDASYEIDYLEISNVDSRGIVDRSAIEHLPFEDAPSRARRIVHEGATIISSVRPSLRAVAYINVEDQNLICSTGFNVVEPLENVLAPKFLYYYLQSDGATHYFCANATGVGYPAVSDKAFGSVVTPIPPRPEQERIAAFLDEKCAAVDKAIEVKRKQLESIEAIWRNLLYRATTQGLAAHTHFVSSGNSLIPKIPEGWKLQKISRCFDLIGSGTTPKTHMQDYYDGNIPWLQSGDLHGHYVFKTAKCVNQQAIEDCNLTIYKAPFIAIAMYGASIANTCIVKLNACTNQACCTLCHPRPNIDPDFIYYSLEASRESLLLQARGGTQPNVSREIIRRLKVALPPIFEQQEIVRNLDLQRMNLDSLATNLRKQIETLELYRKSLIHEYVTGARRVA